MFEADDQLAADGDPAATQSFFGGAQRRAALEACSWGWRRTGPDGI